MSTEPGHTVLGHVILRVFDIGQDQFILVLKIIEKLWMRHACLCRDIPEGDGIDGLFLYTALESHQDLHAHFFFIYNNWHELTISYSYQMVNKTVDREEDA